jgi:hypothetical protein
MPVYNAGKVAPAVPIMSSDLAPETVTELPAQMAAIAKVHSGANCRDHRVAGHAMSQQAPQTSCFSTSKEV